MPEKSFKVSEIKRRLVITNIEEFRELVNKAEKESAQLDETLTQIQNFEFNFEL